MNGITKNQHIVPEFYLNSWKTAGRDVIYLYDLQDKKVSTPNPESALVRRYYYEYDRRLPDNRLEKTLSEMERRVAPVIHSMNVALARFRRYSEEGKLVRELNMIANKENCQIIKEFAAYQYLRIPGAIERKAFELRPAQIPEDVLLDNLKPANFVTTGFDYIKDRFFQEMGVLISYSLEYEFLTSDWPCFDFYQSPYAPVLGVEIGAVRNIFLIFPLSPRMLLTLYSYQFVHPTRRYSGSLIRHMTAGEVKNTNVLIIQQANRWIVHNRLEDFVFAVAAKRPKVTNHAPTNSH